MSNSSRQDDSDNECCTQVCGKSCGMVFHSLELFDQHTVTCNGVLPLEVMPCHKCSNFVLPEELNLHEIMSHKLDSYVYNYKKMPNQNILQPMSRRRNTINQAISENRKYKNMATSTTNFQNLKRESFYGSSSSNSSLLSVDRPSSSSKSNNQFMSPSFFNGLNMSMTQKKKSSQHVFSSIHNLNSRDRNYSGAEEKTLLSNLRNGSKSIVSSLDCQQNRFLTGFDQNHENKNMTDRTTYQNYLKYQQLNKSRNDGATSSKIKTPVFARTCYGTETSRGNRGRSSFSSGSENDSNYKSFNERYQTKFTARNSTNGRSLIEDEEDIILKKKRDAIEVQRMLLEVQERELSVYEREKKVRQRESRMEERESHWMESGQIYEERINELPQDGIQFNHLSSLHIEPCNDFNYFCEGSVQPVRNDSMTESSFFSDDSKSDVCVDMNDQKSTAEINNSCHKSDQLQVDFNKIKKTYARSKSVSSSEEIDSGGYKFSRYNENLDEQINYNCEDNVDSSIDNNLLLNSQVDNFRIKIDHSLSPPLQKCEELVSNDILNIPNWHKSCDNYTNTDIRSVHEILHCEALEIPLNIGVENDYPISSVVNNYMQDHIDCQPMTENGISPIILEENNMEVSNGNDHQDIISANNINVETDVKLITANRIPSEENSKPDLLQTVSSQFPIIDNEMLEVGEFENDKSNSNDFPGQPLDMINNPLPTICSDPFASGLKKRTRNGNFIRPNANFDNPASSANYITSKHENKPIRKCGRPKKSNSLKVIDDPIVSSDGMTHVKKTVGKCNRNICLDSYEPSSSNAINQIDTQQFEPIINYFYNESSCKESNPTTVNASDPVLVTALVGNDGVQSNVLNICDDTNMVSPFKNNEKVAVLSNELNATPEDFSFELSSCQKTKFTEAALSESSITNESPNSLKCPLRKSGRARKSDALKSHFPLNQTLFQNQIVSTADKSSFNSLKCPRRKSGRPRKSDTLKSHFPLNKKLFQNQTVSTADESSFNNLKCPRRKSGRSRKSNALKSHFPLNQKLYQNQTVSTADESSCNSLKSPYRKSGRPRKSDALKSHFPLNQKPFQNQTVSTSDESSCNRLQSPHRKPGRPRKSDALKSNFPLNQKLFQNQTVSTADESSCNSLKSPRRKSGRCKKSDTLQSHFSLNQELFQNQTSSTAEESQFNSLKCARRQSGRFRKTDTLNSHVSLNQKPFSTKKIQSIVEAEPGSKTDQQEQAQETKTCDAGLEVSEVTNHRTEGFVQSPETFEIVQEGEGSVENLSLEESDNKFELQSNKTVENDVEQLCTKKRGRKVGRPRKSSIGDVENKPIRKRGRPPSKLSGLPKEKKCSNISYKNLPTDDVPTQCGNCEKEFTSYKNFFSHALQDHVGLARPMGESQDFEYLERINLIRAAFIKQKNKLYCPLCNKLCISFLGYHIHTLMCGKKESEKYTECKECGAHVRITNIPKHATHHRRPKQTSDSHDIVDEQVGSERPKRKSAVKSFKQILTDDPDDFNSEKTFNVDDSLAIDGDLDDFVSFDKKTFNNLKKQPSFEISRSLIHKSMNISESVINDLQIQLKDENEVNCPNEGCFRKFQSAKDFKRHIRTCKYSKFILYCKICKFSSECMDKMNGHVDSHWIKKISSPYYDEFPLAVFRLGSHSISLCHEFLTENFSNLTFPEFTCNINEWQIVHDMEKNFAAQILYKSVPFKVCSKGGNSDWIRLPNFGSYNTENGCVMFAGGDILSSAWCPLPLECAGNTQYLALSCSAESAAVTGNDKANGHSLQIWALNVAGNVAETEMVFTFNSVGGSILSLRWCPSGAYQVDDDNLKRLGILAASCSNGSVCIYTIPHPIQLPQVHALYKKEPDLILTPFDFIPFEICCTKIDWFLGKGHEYIAGCYSNGCVSIWDLNITSEPWRIIGANSSSILRSSIWFSAHLFPCTTIAFCPNTNGKHIATSAVDRITRIWDLDYVEHPLSDFRKGVATDSLWLPYWSGIVLSFNDVVGRQTIGTIFKESDFLGGHTVGMLPSESSVWCLSGSYWYNGVVQGNDTGVAMAINHRATFSTESTKAFHKSVYCIFETGVEEVSTSCESSQFANEKSFGICFYDGLNKPFTRLLEEVGNQPLIDRLRISTSICWNNNYGGHNWLFVSNKAGLGRFIHIPTITKG